MTDELKPVRCGCGGEAIIHNYSGIKREGDYTISCSKCRILTDDYPTEAEAITAWNRAMGAKDINVPNKFATDTNVGDKERTAKVRDKKDDPMVDEWHHGRCMNCGKQVRRKDNYCSRCGCRLEWNE